MQPTAAISVNNGRNAGSPRVEIFVDNDIMNVGMYISQKKRQICLSHINRSAKDVIILRLEACGFLMMRNKAKSKCLLVDNIDERRKLLLSRVKAKYGIISK